MIVQGSLSRPVLSFLAICLSQPVFAQTPDDGRGRYALSPIEGGFLRLDKETGAVSMCIKKDASWSCEPVSDKALHRDDKDRVENENKVLRERLKELEAKQQATGNAPAKSDQTPETGKLPSEEEVDKALDTMERIFKKIKDRLQKYQTTPESNPPASEPKSKTGDGSGAL